MALFKSAFESLFICRLNASPVKNPLKIPCVSVAGRELQDISRVDISG